jgi:hypothetical protein
MSLKNKERAYSIASFTSNIITAVGIIFLAIYLLMPLFGGELFLDAILKYASWCCIGFSLKIVMKRATKGLRIRVRDYLLLCLVLIFNLFAWLPYPANLFLGLLGIIGFIISFKYNNRGV